MSDVAIDSWDIYKDKSGAYRWRRRGRADKIIGRSCESYVAKTDCTANAERHGLHGNPQNLGQRDKWEIYKDKRSKFRWRRIARNGRITGTSAEGFPSRTRCEANAKLNGKH